MKGLLSSFLLLFAFASSFGETVTNKVVFVDQHGKINAPEVVASVADMTSNRTEIAIAQAAAQAAEKAAREGTNLVAATVQSITENEFVVYRQGFTDSLGVAVVLPPDTKCLIVRFNPNIATDGAGNAQHEIVYATTADASAVTPGIKHSSTVGPKDAMKKLDTQIEKKDIPLASYVGPDGTQYPYVYSVKFWLPAADQGFFIVYLDADAADGNGITFDIVGGITGGYSGEIPFGSTSLLFQGGLLMEVKGNVVR
jgi:hypothetical protein